MKLYSKKLTFFLFLLICFIPSFQAEALDITESQCGSRNGGEGCSVYCDGDEFPFATCENNTVFRYCCVGENSGPINVTGLAATPVDEDTPIHLDYEPLEGIPGTEGTPEDFPAYVQALYKFMIWGVAIAALLMLIIGGFWYMTAAGNNAQLTTAKKIILDAILGIFIAFFAWIILFTINPDLVNVNLDSLKLAKPNNVGSIGNATTVYTPSPDDTTTWNTNEQEARDLITANGLTVNKHPCPGGVRYQDVSGGCTSVEGLTEDTIQKIANVSNMGCDFTITGGTELGHRTHGPGKQAVDLRTNTTPREWVKCEQLLKQHAFSSTQCEVKGKKRPCSDPNVDHIHAMYPK